MSSWRQSDQAGQPSPTGQRPPAGAADDNGGMSPTLSPVPRPLSGEQFAIAAGPYRAAIASVGASLRRLRLDGRDLVVPYHADQVRPSYRGAVLAPWPNRVIDGRYSSPGAGDGSSADAARQLALTEPERSHALHGLALWLDFAVTARDPASVSLSQVIEPQAGYPWRIALEVAYRLDAVGGLDWRVTARNIGPGTAPYGTGPHPYLVAGPAPLDQWRLTLPAGGFIATEGARLAPAGRRDVDGGDFDFRAGRVLGGVQIDHAFCDVAWDADGFAEAVLEDPSGSGAAIAWDQACPWVQVHTADLPKPAPNRLGLAVEPMTCPPDAFNSRQDLIWLAPGQSHQAVWRLKGW
ncbi:MAG: aldose 1-epimerase family protein [Bifidobacteriaceae bacterium]|jgi:aldose 1-epimerase|nr:aldose 1-epimerase family protein [Bifidobacteriaceae bacterium]